MVGRLVSGWMVGFLVGWWLNGVGLLVGRLAGGSMVGEVRPRGGGWVEDRHLDRISLSATSATISNGFWHKMFSFPPNIKIQMQISWAIHLRQYANPLSVHHKKVQRIYTVGPLQNFAFRTTGPRL